MTDPLRMMTLEEVAQYLQVSSKTVYRMVQDRQVPCFKLGRQWRFKREQLDDWLLKEAYRPPNEEKGAA